MIWTYVQFGLLLLSVGGFLAKRAPLSVIAGIWLLMMCWEVYDLHADHIVAYSAVLAYAAHKAIHRPVAVKAKVAT